MKYGPVVLLIAIATASAQVPFERIRKTAAEPGNWLTYSGNYEAHRFSPLTQLTPANVAGLKPKWLYQVHNEGNVETTPLVFDGVMYLTDSNAGLNILQFEGG